MSDDELQRAHARWAAEGVVLAAGVFEASVGERRARVGARALHIDDLHLACACARGDRAALRAFDQSYTASVRRTLRRAGVPETIVDDVLGDLPMRLFTAADGGVPQIHGYTGRGDLGAWARSVALHGALKLLRRARKQVPFDDGVEDVPLVDPELVHLRELYASSLGELLRVAFAALEPAERAILRQYYRHGLTIDDLGRMHGVHRVTAARRVKHARESLVGAVRARAREQLEIDTESVDSVLRLCGSRLAVERLLRTTEVLG